MAYLIADIGATHARFAVHPGAGGAPGLPLRLPTGDYVSAQTLLENALETLGLAAISGACLAVAGPVAEGIAEITNGGLCFDEAELSAALGCPIQVVNDFYALAMALPVLENLECVGGDSRLAEVRGVKAVLGPGSGLGMSVLVPLAAGGWQVLPSEGGHADLAPGNPLEQEVLTLLQSTQGSVCWETVLSGPGLVHLYGAVAALWGARPRELRPEEISLHGIEADDPVCHQTLEMFFGLLGAAAGNLALTVCARSGVYIGGGIVPALAEFARTSPLRRRFEERAGLEAFVADIPLFLILDDQPGLLGAARCLKATGNG